MPTVDPKSFDLLTEFYWIYLNSGTRAKIGKNLLKFDPQVIRNSRKDRVLRLNLD